MRKLMLLAIATLAMLSATTPALAGWNEFWASVATDFRRNNSWPRPFQQQDRELVREPFRVMINKGWQMQNTLSDYHFDPKTNALTNAGVYKLRSIVTNPTPSRRTVFVLRSRTEDITRTRVDEVQQAVAGVRDGVQLPMVLVTDIAPPGASGAAIQVVQEQWNGSQPSPRLTGGGGGGGGDGS